MELALAGGPQTAHTVERPGAVHCSEEVFTFEGAMGKVFGFIAKPAIHRAHRKQMEAFKRFAERNNET